MATEQKVGTVTDYYAKISVAAIKLVDGALQVGDTIHIRGHTTDLTQTVESLQTEHRPVQRAAPVFDTDCVRAPALPAQSCSRGRQGGARRQARDDRQKGDEVPLRVTSRRRRSGRRRSSRGRRRRG